MEFNSENNREFIRIKGGRITATTKVFTGKDGEFYVMLAPTLLVSGYGNTEEEAVESFKSNIDLFCHDIFKLSSNQIAGYLKGLGFHQERSDSKNFSKLFIDDKGALQGLEEGTIKSKMHTVFI